MKTLQYAHDAWKYLNGIFCIYKPPDLYNLFAKKTLAFNLCRDLNQMEKRPQQELVMLKGSVSTNKPFSVELIPNYADHELVSGPRYQDQDVRITEISALGKKSSGVLLMAVNDGCKHAKNLKECNFLCKYVVKGRFGLGTDTHMADGKVQGRFTYSHIRQAQLDRLLASIQASHQALGFKYSGVDIYSQEAYELASKGIVRPSGKSDPIIYGMKCTDFELPNFTLEIHCINENEMFLAELVQQIGVYLKSCAVCTQLRRTQFGHFTLEHALLRKHWTLEYILSNITLCKNILGEDGYAPQTAHFDSVELSRLKNVIKDMQDKVREDSL
ncbi:hypothetical protein JTE90_023512 [Oedothorax gibbosus]|uniref:Pseudouridine synthase II N-terminal domain-containing protein n=1 Tax=Oedothorax gibbosus TaxID=931172 RepID=A0AAV6VQ38_9ARAC|nr:hypothetical protein JTE90_023512 [Oedothorax gibbosus]